MAARLRSRQELSLHNSRRLIASLCLAALILGACGGGSSKPKPSSSPASTATTGAAPTATPTSATDAIGTTAVDGQRTLDHVRKLSVEIGPRVAGTPGEIAARDYIRATLESYGYDVSLQDFGFDASAYLPARVDGGPAPGPSTITSIPAIALRGSSAGTVMGKHLVVAGIGRPEDFPPGGLAGDVALIERGELTFSQKVGNAVAAGASAVIIYNNVPERGIFDLADAATIPAVGIDQAAGRDLVAKVGRQAQEVRVEVLPPKGTAYNVIARPKGVTSCDTISGGHYDSVPVTGGADDNAAGTATVLELARVVAAMKLPAHHCFALFSGEEFGLFGSKAYVERLTDAERTALHGMVNLDVVGNANSLELIGSADLIDVARLAAQQIGIEARASSLPPNTGSDHLSFLNGGIPVVMLYRADGLIHTPQDSIERIVAGSLADTVSVALATLQALAQGP